MAASKRNKYALGNTGGRPPKYVTPNDLNRKCIEFFDDCIKHKEKPTITGLVLFLGFCDQDSLRDYSEKNKEFCYIIKRAKETVRNAYELSGTTMDIFVLKIMGWKEIQEETIKTLKVKVIEED